MMKIFLFISLPVSYKKKEAKKWTDWERKWEREREREREREERKREREREREREILRTDSFKY